MLSRGHFLWRRSIDRELAGLLRPAAADRLRAHLVRCEACRQRYDQLRALAQALGTGSAGAAAHAQRERDRLLRAIDDSGTSSPVRRDWSRRRNLTVLTLLPAAALLALWIFPRARHEQKNGDGATEVTWRGDPAPSAPAGVALLVYASAKKGQDGHGQLRLVAELPRSGEGQVSRADYVQFAVSALPVASYSYVVGIDAQGGFHQYVPRPGTPASMVSPTTRAQPLGVSIDLGAGHPPGRVLVYGLFSAEPLDVERVRAAAARVDRASPHPPRLDMSGAQAAGVLIVQP